MAATMSMRRRWKFAAGLLLPLLGFVSADLAHANGFNYSMGVNATRQFYQSADPYQGGPLQACPYAVGHGNIYGVAYSRIYMGDLNNAVASTTSCLTVRTNVTACSGLSCPTSDWVSAIKRNEWFQAQLSNRSLLHSHSSVRTHVDNWRLHHYCVPTVSC